LSSGWVQGRGLLIPRDHSLPPLAMTQHKVNITIEDQVNVTQVEQTFRNHTPRPLEATYIFPVPKGASVNKFTMWVDGKETKGELVEAKKAREIYTSIVRRTMDPGLLEYLGTDLLQMRVFPVPPNGEQRVALSYTAVAGREGDLVEYVYPLKTDSRSLGPREAFTLEATIKSQHAVQNVYSPTHAITLKRTSDKQVTVGFEKATGQLDQDFQLFYQLGDKDVGLTALTHRPSATEGGYFLALVTPKVAVSKSYQVPRDMVLVLDTSGSMRGAKMEQARKAVKFCLEKLTSQDRLALIQFATTVTRFKDNLLEGRPENLAAANKWLDTLEPTGGTAINEALASALELRPKEESRTFTIVFFTDGQPTIGETNIEQILKNTLSKNTKNTRIFTFGVGDDVNAAMLDQLADQTRAVSTYVRPSEDIAAKTTGLYDKISHPVLANLKLITTGTVSLTEVYPAQLPDLFHGQQMVVLGRYTGQGAAALKLSGAVGSEAKEFVYELTFPQKTGEERVFVEEIWARRKVGYMLDQIRLNGEKKELVDEVVTLAKKYGITTPYTSWLIVPDTPVPIVPPPVVRPGPVPLPAVPPALVMNGRENAPQRVTEFARQIQQRPGDLALNRGRFEDLKFQNLPAAGEAGGRLAVKALEAAKAKKDTYDRSREALARRDFGFIQAGQNGVELALHNSTLRNQVRLEQKASRQVNGRNCLEVGGVWIDENFDPKMRQVVVRAQSAAYFRILELQPRMKDVFRLGNHLVWVAPGGQALVVDTQDGKEKMSDEEINKLFVAMR
jgi:Ca-activated chloride channel family protein